MTLSKETTLPSSWDGLILVQDQTDVSSASHLERGYFDFAALHELKIHRTQSQTQIKTKSMALSAAEDPVYLNAEDCSGLIEIRFAGRSVALSLVLAAFTQGGEIVRDDEIGRAHV